jgi:hypothetical protein
MLRKEARRILKSRETSSLERAVAERFLAGFGTDG